MTLEATESFYGIADGQIVSGPYPRPGQYGVNALDPELWTGGDARLWEDTGNPVQPGPYYRKVIGELIVASERVERVDYWDDSTPERKRQRIVTELDDQVPRIDVTDEILDHTRRGATDQIALRNKAAKEQLAATSDAGLDAFLTDLNDYEISEPEYAGNILQQDLANLALHDQLVAIDGIGLYDTAERSAMEQRILENSGTRRAIRTGVSVPEGAAREDVALDGETTEDAVIFETSFDWVGTDYYLPQAKLSSILDGVDPAGVVLMVYDQDNVYRSWQPFIEQPDGTWLSRADPAFDTGAAKQASSKWRCAITHGGTSSEQEITRRVYVIPPDSVTSKVRWGGRNGETAAQAGGRGRRQFR